MPLDKALYPNCDTEGPFGVWMPDAVAKYVQKLLDEHKGHGDEIVKLASSAEVQVDSDRTEISKITTESVDRDKEVVIAKGVDLKAFQDNPVVLLNHDWYAPPIGKALWIKKSTDNGVNGLKAKTLYATRPADAVGEWTPDSILGLLKQDMMKGKSIGFIPLERRSVEKSDVQSNPQWKDARAIIPKCVLLEYSVVTIPSNPDAMCETAWKNYPGLAAILDLPKPEEKTVEPVTMEQLMAEIKRLQDEQKPLYDRISFLESEREVLSRGLARVREDFIRRPATAKEPTSSSRSSTDVLKALRKLLPRP